MFGWRVWLAAFVLVLVPAQLAVGMRASTTATVTGDEPFYLLTAQSLVSDGDLDLGDEYGDPDREMARFWDGTKPLWKQMEPTADGRLLSPHDPGLSLLLAPAYAAGGLEGVRRFLVAVWAAAMGFAALLARRTGAPAWAAVLAATAVGAGTPGLVYASQVYPEGPAALCLAAALLFATGPPALPAPPALPGAPALRLPFRSPGGPLEGWWHSRKGNLDGIGVVLPLVALVWLGVKYLPYAVLIGGIWAWRNRREPGRLALAGGVVAVTAVHFVWWHVDTFGALTPYTTNVVWAGEGTSSIVGDHLRLPDRTYRLYGLFLDARFGLFRWLPIAPLALWGVTARTRVHLLPLAIATALGTFLSITIMGYWFPGRMLVAALPSLAVLLATAAARYAKSALTLAAWSWTIAAAVALAAAPETRLIRLAVDPWTLDFPLPPTPLFPDFRQFGAEEITKSILWALALAGALAVTRGAGAGWRVARRKGPAQGGTHEVGGSPVWEGS